MSVLIAHDGETVLHIQQLLVVLSKVLRCADGRFLRLLATVATTPRGVFLVRSVLTGAATALPAFPRHDAGAAPCGCLMATFRGVDDSSVSQYPLKGQPIALSHRRGAVVPLFSPVLSIDSQVSTRIPTGSEPSCSWSYAIRGLAFANLICFKSRCPSFVTLANWAWSYASIPIDIVDKSGRGEAATFRHCPAEWGVCPLGPFHSSHAEKCPASRRRTRGRAHSVAARSRLRVVLPGFLRWEVGNG